MTNGNTPCISGGYTNMMTEEDGDLIRRSEALECFHDWVDKYGDVHTPDEMAEYRAIEELPSVEQEKRTEERTETHACDCISKAMVCEIMADIYPTDGEKIVAVKDIDEAYEKILQLPSAQPEIIRCRDCVKRETCRTTNIWAVAPDDDWFCGDAERRTDG